MNLKKILKDIQEQKEGYVLGDPWQKSETSLGGIVPILNTKAKNRKYIMLEEAQEKKAIKITDTGSIEKVKIMSDADGPVFVRQGTIFEGDTQERGAIGSMVIMPTKEEIAVPVRCVHASKGISSGARMTVSSASAPRETIRAFSVNSNQSEVWNSVTMSAGRMQTSALASGFNFKGTDDALDNIKQVKKAKEKIGNWIKDVPRLVNQVGVIIFDTKGIYAIETFDHPNSWTAFHDKIYEQYDDIVDNEQEGNLYKLNKDKIPGLIDAFFKDFGACKETVTFQEGSATTYSLRGKVLGEKTILNDKIIHLLGMRKENDA